MNVDRAVAQYLERHAEPEAGLAASVTREFGHVLTIPAAGEHAGLTALLDSVPAGASGDVLVICVVNARADSPDEIHEANAALLAELHSPFGASETLGRASHWIERSHGALWLLDRASKGRELPERQGVGLARKIAADLALALWRQRCVLSNWIHCTDADAWLPDDYFSRPLGAPSESSALVYPFRHVGADGTDPSHAALEYEIWLRYYVAGLAWAQSPYAFHTIGSTLAPRADAYARVRGFPRRLAAEDFYLLDKLAKYGPVASLDGAPIALSDRMSARVPFGTGRAMHEAQMGKTRTLYHPEIFACLRSWQEALRELARAPHGDPRALIRDMASAENAAALDDALTRTGGIPHGIAAARTETARLRQLHQHFDAGRTLQLVHALRDGSFGSLPIPEAADRAPFVRWEAAGGSGGIQGILASLVEHPFPEVSTC